MNNTAPAPESITSFNISLPLTGIISLAPYLVAAYDSSEQALAIARETLQGLNAQASARTEQQLDEISNQFYRLNEPSSPVTAIGVAVAAPGAPSTQNQVHSLALTSHKLIVVNAAIRDLLR